jgi:ribonuclease P protein component
VQRGAISVRHLRDDGATPRVAFTIGRRVGNAVQRNRARRRVRAALASIVDELEPGAYLVGATADVVTMPFETLCEQVRDATRAARVTS